MFESSEGRWGPIVHGGARPWDGGGIGIDKDGTIGWAHNGPMFVVGYVTGEIGEPSVFLKKDEEFG